MTLDELQEQTWQAVFKNEQSLNVGEVLLCGGTALARLYLHHRVSYDLDFFVSSRFNPSKLLIDLQRHDIVIRNPVFETSPEYSRQLMGNVVQDDVAMKIDFIEDIYFGMFDKAFFGGVKSEVIDGLYHRKVRTISGCFDKDRNARGGRQTVRDVFDLFVLNQEVERLSKFVERIDGHGANIPIENLASGIIKMPWMDMMNDFDELERLGKWGSDDITLIMIKRILENEALKMREMAYETRFGY